MKFFVKKKKIMLLGKIKKIDYATRTNEHKRAHKTEAQGA